MYLNGNGNGNANVNASSSSSSLSSSSSVSFVCSGLDLATLGLVSALLILSLLSVFLILHLRLRSRVTRQLQNFNSAWSVRLLLVVLICMWGLNELLRVPFFRWRYPYPFLPSLSLLQQSHLCKMYILLSLGLYQPAFLLALLFLLNASLTAPNPQSRSRRRGCFRFCRFSPLLALFFSLPLFLLHLLFTFPPFHILIPLPELWTRSSAPAVDDYGNPAVLCAFPPLNSLLFSAFALLYALCFLLSSWRLVSLVINKALRFRIYALTAAVLFSLSVQLLSLGVSALFSPTDTLYDALSTLVFLSVLFCASIGEGILVIRPISEALSVGDDFFRWSYSRTPDKRVAEENAVVQPQGEETKGIMVNFPQS